MIFRLIFVIFLKIFTFFVFMKFPYFFNNFEKLNKKLQSNDCNFLYTYIIYHLKVIIHL